MSFAVSLYDALTTINVPRDQALAVVRALDEKMTSELATKADFQLLRQEFHELCVSIVSEFDAIKLRLSNGEARQGSVEARLDSVEARLTNVEKRLDSVEARLTNVEKRLDSVEARLTKVEDYLTALDRKVTELAVEIRSLENRLILKMSMIMGSMISATAIIASWLG